MKKLLALLLALSLVAVFTAMRDRTLRATDRELLRLGVEDAARTVRRTSFNAETICTVGEASVLSLAHTVADLARKDRTYLENQDRLDALRAALEIDHLGFTDEKGVCVTASPAKLVGTYLGRTAYGRAFLPAITNRAYACLQPGTAQAFGKRYQYAGVARTDRSGVVFIGFLGSIAGGFTGGTSAEDRIAEMRIGREGWIEAEPCEGLPPARTAVSIADIDGERVYVLETDCDDYRIRAFVPLHGGPLADDRPFAVLLIAVVLLLLSLFASYVPALRAALQENGAALVLLFGRRARLRNYPVLVALPLLLAVLGGYACYEWSGISRGVDDVLKIGISDILGDLDSMPNLALYLRAKSICLTYGSPDAITPSNVVEIARTYDLDELNVVDSRRHIVATTMKVDSNDPGLNMDAREETRIFNAKLLDEGAQMYVAPFRRSVCESQFERKYMGVAFARSRGGYVQAGFDRRRVRHELSGALSAVAHDWRLGTAGFFLVLDAATGRIVSSGNGRFPEGTRLAGMPPGCRAWSAEVGDLKVIAAYPEEAIREAVVDNVALNATILIALAVLVTVLFGRLSGLVAELRRFIAEDGERRRRDLALARTIQLSSLPVALVDCDRYKVFATTVPAREVGGDFYDSYALADGRVVVTVADVSGKGVPAALFMMRAKTALKSAVMAAGGDLAAAVPVANRQLCQSNEAEMFVTAWVGVYDPATGEVKYVSAGHNPPLVKRADGSVEWVRPRPSLVLAAMDVAKYRVETLTLRAGDSLFVYTDGVTEAQNAAGELFGEPRLEAALKASGPLFVDEIGRVVGAFVAGAEPSDDLTMMALDCRKTGGPS